LRRHTDIAGDIKDTLSTALISYNKYYHKYNQNHNILLTLKYKISEYYHIELLIETIINYFVYFRNKNIQYDSTL